MSLRALRERLHSIALNLAWTWKPEVRELLQDALPRAWEEASGNPLRALPMVRDEALGAWHQRGGNGAWLQAVERELAGDGSSPEVIYLSMEFGLHETLPIYSGGLGILSGDHLKAASDRGMSLAGVGLLYREGYFRQGVDAEGTQTATHPPIVVSDVPVSPLVDGTGAVQTVRVPIGDRVVHAAIWRVRVGRVDLWLLDTDVEENSPQDRRLTARLYGGDPRYRIEQEVLLGRGSVQLVDSILRVDDPKYHLNEGHCAFAQLERIHRRMGDNFSFEEALTAVRERTVFTTHTPVPAGNESFPADLMEVALAPLQRDLDVSWAKIHRLGAAPGDEAGLFSMTALALRTARSANGVSQLHGEVAREMWAGLWPDLEVEEVPIGAVTNGVHASTWVGPEMRALLEVHGPLSSHACERDYWGRLSEMDEEVIWEAHLEQKRRLCDLVRDRAGVELDADALVVGFARRFATYKRATLVLADLDALFQVLVQGEWPVQLVFAGKAHPADEPGQELIREVVRVSQDPRFRRRVLFLEDYDMILGRGLTQGVDVWLNTPRRPHEASGTSGMKALMNGALNCSVMDGWWDEAFAPDLGWAIEGTSGSSDEEVDLRDHATIIQLLEGEIVPLFADRCSYGVPREWVRRMRAAMMRHGASFSADRMVREYARCYGGIIAPRG